MMTPTTTGLRRSLVTALIVALSLAGLGGALASAAQASPGAAAGLHAPICHSGGKEAPAGPARPAPHGCCDGCAPAALPAPPAAAGPAPVGRIAGHVRAAPRAPLLARPRDPRLSRGPPAA